MTGKLTGSEHDPYIVSLGPTFRVHPRHFVQRSEYTLCFKSSAETDYLGSEYWPHETAFMLNEPHQDLLFKINIPVSERRNALRYLDLHNITKHSLFDTIDTLMESLAIREYALEE